MALLQVEMEESKQQQVATLAMALTVRLRRGDTVAFRRDTLATQVANSPVPEEAMAIILQVDAIQVAEEVMGNSLRIPMTYQHTMEHRRLMIRQKMRKFYRS